METRWGAEAFELVLSLTLLLRCWGSGNPMDADLFWSQLSDVVAFKVVDSLLTLLF